MPDRPRKAGEFGTAAARLMIASQRLAGRLSTNLNALAVRDSARVSPRVTPGCPAAARGAAQDGDEGFPGCPKGARTARGRPGASCEGFDFRRPGSFLWVFALSGSCMYVRVVAGFLPPP